MKYSDIIKEIDVLSPRIGKRIVTRKQANHMYGNVNVERWLTDGYLQELPRRGKMIHFAVDDLERCLRLWQAGEDK